ncbi:ribonuclease HII [Melissococcus sp. OM08-11BH]|uniref:ribonuclease HII n=1 Tax=Melissococcus sp. OM08-11BH TaxID=2293110 RepID=UPI000E53C03A|nr:ribonuclease HII [Melissococcus sp. OM08-11BH]RGI30777.1 ribonuclease HII [Melissococcus sp. OM08-11BH]
MSETIQSIKEKFSFVTDEKDDLFAQYQQDERKGVQKIIDQTKKRLQKQQVLKEHFIAMTRYEKKARVQGHNVIVGIDEVGRGPLAGPVVAAAVVLPDDFDGIGINDSKQLSLKKREEFFDKIQEQAVSIGIGIMNEEVIDSVNIYEATKLAMIEAVNQLTVSPDCLLIDAMTLPLDIPQESIIKGDANSISIASASIIAKVTRDHLMMDYDKEYPGYGFAKNAGYGTKEHLDQLNKQGITKIHRKSFEPIKSMIN